MTNYCHVEGCGGVSVTSGTEHLCRRHYQRKFVDLLPDWDEPQLGQKWEGSNFKNWDVFLRDWRERIVPALCKD